MHSYEEILFYRFTVLWLFYSYWFTVVVSHPELFKMGGHINLLNKKINK